MNKFQINTLLLNNQSLTATGNILYLNGVPNVNSYQVFPVSGAFNLNSSNSIYLVNTITSGATGTFPNASGYQGQIFIIKDWQGNALTNNILLTGINNELFDGSPTFTINISYQSINVLSDGANWSVI